MRQSVYCMLLALGFLMAAEFTLRALRRDGTLPYSYRKGGYLALVPELDEHGAGSIAIVGSSRAREAILSPTLEKALLAALRREKPKPGGATIEVRNYALSGAHADAVNQTIRHLLDAEPPPELIVYGVTPLQLETQRTDPAHHVSYTWEIGDAWDAFRRGAEDAPRYLPNAVRNELAHASWWVRLRPTVRAALRRPWSELAWQDLHEVWQAPEQQANPMRGQLPPKQQGKDRNRVIRVGKRRIEKYLDGLYQEPEYPHTRQVAWLRDSLSLCRESGVELLLVELPAAPALRRYSPEHTYPGFNRLFTELSNEFDVPFVPIDEVDVTFEARDFREQSHLTYVGAVKFSRALAPVIVREGRLR